MAVFIGATGFNKLNDGTEYRTTNEGYILIKGKRQIYIIAKSVVAGQEAKNIIASNSFDKLFKKGKKIAALGSNVSYIKL
jgi:hypothetical protein